MQPSTRSSRRIQRPSPTIRAGKAQAVGFLIGQVMKATGGQANAALVGAAVRRTTRRGLTTDGGSRVGLLNIALWVAGAALIALGYTRARGPYSRYQALKSQDANVARYEAWRGGVRDDGKTGASVAMARPPPADADRGRDRDRRRRAGVPRVLHPLTSRGRARCGGATICVQSASGESAESRRRLANDET